jgi:hypothetical protein
MDNIRSWIFVDNDDRWITEKDKLIINNPKEFLKEIYSDEFVFGLHNLQDEGIFLLMGRAYDFRPYLKKFVYKSHGSWREIYAPNKTLLRKSMFRKIDKIVELV